MVIRLLVGEPLELAAVALAFLQAEASAGRRCQVSDLVVAESYFALHSHYGVPELQSLEILLRFLKSPFVEPTGVARPALETALRSSAKPGFVDRLIHLQYAPARLATFEKAAAKLPESLLLSR